MHLTLFIPELIWPEPGDSQTLGELQLPGLDWFLGRANIERLPPRPLEASLTACFDLPEAPCAPLRLLGEGHSEARKGHWLCADPVHLRFHHERIVLADASAFELDLNEAHDLVTALNCEFSDIGHFHVGNARRWYLKLHEAVDHPAQPLSMVAGRRVDGGEPGSLPLTRLLNEIQMYLHDHPVNTARQVAGKPAINSVWLWGGGTLPAEPSAPAFTSVFTDEPLASGLALATRIPGSALVDALGELPPAAGARPLVVLNGLLQPVLYENALSWRDTLADIDAHWLLPAKNALGRGVDRITLIAPTIYGEIRCTVSPGAQWTFWKRRQSLQAFAQTLA